MLQKDRGKRAEKQREKEEKKELENGRLEVAASFDCSTTSFFFLLSFFPSRAHNAASR